MIGRAEAISNTTGNLIPRIVWLNVNNLPAQQIWEVRMHRDLIQEGFIEDWSLHVNTAEARNDTFKQSGDVES